MGNVGTTLVEAFSPDGKDPAKVCTKTADCCLTGTNNDVYIIFHDEKGNKSNKFELHNILQKVFKRGTTDTFRILDIGGSLGDISMIEIWRDGLPDDNLFLDLVVVQRKNFGKQYEFPIHRWIPIVTHLFIRVYDSSLPQEDPHLEQRRRELEQKRAVYQLEQKAPGLPVQVVTLPIIERFTPDYLANLKAVFQNLLFMIKWKQMTTAKWRCFDDILKMYTTQVLPLPPPAKDKLFLDDEYFGEQRVSGCNPGMLRLCTKIPDK